MLTNGGKLYIMGFVGRIFIGEFEFVGDFTARDELR